MPEEDIDPRNWRTELDDFDHRGKYWYREPSQSSMQRVVGRAVVARLCRLIGEHPLLNAMTASSQFPGTTGAWFLRGKACQQSAANQLGLSLAPHWLSVRR